jgi:hypothetical protein
MICWRGVPSPRTGYSTISRNLWRNDPESPTLDPSENTIEVGPVIPDRTVDVVVGESGGPV